MERTLRLVLSDRVKDSKSVIDPDSSATSDYEKESKDKDKEDKDKDKSKDDAGDDLSWGDDWDDVGG